MILTIVAFLVILGILVFVHEFGHFFMARRMNVKVDEFGFGFPPRLVGVRKRQTDTTNQDTSVKKVKKWEIVWGNKIKSDSSPHTIYSLNWIPIGGFVKIKGEQGEGEGEPDSFVFQKIWKRILIIASGVIMNFILAIVLLSIGFSIGIPTVIDESIDLSRVRDPKIQIIEVAEQSPAQKANLREGDILMAIDGQPVSEIKDIQQSIAGKENQEVKLDIIRGDQKIVKNAVPKILTGSGDRPVLGVGLVKTGIISYPIHTAIYKGAESTFYLMGEIVRVFGEIIGRLFTGQKVSADVAGPVGIAVLTGRVVSLGIVYVLQFAALLSINLGIINILPIPALDGGRILFLIIEKIKGRAVNQKVENLIHNIGFIFLMALVAVVTYKDFERWGGKILEALKRLL